MQKKDCKAALDVYKKFITRMNKVQDFLRTAEDVGFDKEDIPDLSKAPNSLLDALENHYLALEKGKAPSAHKYVKGSYLLFSHLFFPFIDSLNYSFIGLLRGAFVSMLMKKGK